MSGAPPGGNWFLAWKASGPLDRISGLCQHAPPAIRWYHPDDYHVTLAFFGRLAPDAVARVAKQLATGGSQQIGAAIGKPLLLPGARRFSALAFSIESAELRNAIAGQRDQWLKLAEVAPETRDPLPHLTFARPDRRARPPQLRAIREWMETLSLPNERVFSFEGPALFTRDPGGQGRAFRIVASASRSS